MNSYEVVNTLIATTGLLGGAIGFIVSLFAKMRAARADQKAEEAQRKAANALASVADAQADAAASLASSADSQKQIVEVLRTMVSDRAELTANDVDFVKVFEDALAASVEWQIESRDIENSYRLRNIGTLQANAVRISAVPPEHAGLLVGGDLGDVPPASAGIFAVSPRLTLTLRKIAVTWIDSDTEFSQSIELSIP